MQNGADILEDSLVIYYKNKDSPTVQSNNHAPWLPKGGQSLYTEVHGSFIHKCQNLEATMISFSRQMDK